MLLIPTIALGNGKSVAARAAAPNQRLPADEPIQMAAHWIKAGARRLHVADTYSTEDTKTSGVDVIQALAQGHPGLTLQVGGAIRDEQAVEKYLAAGAEYVILDTKAASTPHFVNDLCLEYPGHILVALEARQGKVVAEGWSKLAQHSAMDVAQHFQREGVAAILYRAADADQGDLAVAQSLAQALTIPVLVSGGLGSVKAVAQLCRNSSALGGAVLDAEFGAEATDFPKVMRLAERPAAEE